MPPLQLLELLKPGHWFEPHPGAPSAYYYAVAALLVIGTVASAYFSFFDVRRRFRDHAFRARLFVRFGRAYVGLFAVGLALVLLRFGGVGYLSARFLLYLDLLGMLGVAAFAAYYLTCRYRLRLAEYDAEALRQKYLPRPGTGRGSKNRKRKKDQRKP